MSVNDNSGNYAPLKQIITDSDSDEDHNNAVIKASESCNNLEYNSGLQSSKNYSLSDMDQYNTNGTMDSVSFLHSDDVDASKKMSFSRRCSFIASIFLCIFTVVVFLWGIPCSEGTSCANTYSQDKTTSWELPYEEIELSGAIQVVDGAIPNTKNLIFIYRGNHMMNTKNSNDNVNGVLLIVGNSGKVGWYTRETRIPTDINCHLLDVNRDMQDDCIVTGTEGLFAALKPLSGTYYWYIHKQGKVFSNIASIDFPIVVKDMDQDKVKDLLTVVTVYPNTKHNSLLLISGATGNIIGDPMGVDNCFSVKLLSETDAITYLCKNGTTQAVRQITYEELYKKLLSLDHTLNDTSATISIISKKIKLSLKKNIGNTKQIFTNGPGRLRVENYGECPSTCRVSLKLLLDRNGKTNVTWEYSANHVFAMRPSSFAFANSIRGFVLKL
ncbi:unnamed protein product [Leptidea sinapis]|uniref:FAM234A/B beta-propeller domain-containing protein n=1 Tax=Leptidea sinapis TaxID=189913 RepID=A0A5E4R3D8_9NEOP|nr:unnamed protein product [Leptidea sinapis]